MLKRHWAGDDDVLEVIRRILKLGDKMGRTGLLEKGVRKRIKGMLWKFP
jgi:hypothetical protein